MGAIDGKHIRVTKFPRSGSMNLNYKCYFSIVLMAVANSDYKFTYVDIGAYGKDCDLSVCQETFFFKVIKFNERYYIILYTFTNTVHTTHFNPNM